MYICMCTKNYLNATLSAGSPPERLVEALSRNLQTNDSSEKLRGTFYTQQSCTFYYTLKRTELTIRWSLFAYNDTVPILQSSLNLVQCELAGRCK